MNEKFPKETEKRISPPKIPRRLLMNEREITHFEDVDVDKLKQSFNEWVDKFLDQFRKTIETEMTDPQTRGNVERIEDDDSLKFKFVTEFNFSIQRVKDSDEKD